MELPLGIVVLALALAWLSTMGHWLLAVQHRKPEVPVTKFLFSGFVAFDPNHFTERGQVYQRRFGISFAVFFLLMFVGFGLLVATGALADAP